MLILSLLLIPMYYVDVPYPFVADINGGRMENPIQAFQQIADNLWIAVALGGAIFRFET